MFGMNYIVFIADSMGLETGCARQSLGITKEQVKNSIWWKLLRMFRKTDDNQ